MVRNQLKIWAAVKRTLWGKQPRVYSGLPPLCWKQWERCDRWPWPWPT